MYKMIIFDLDGTLAESKSPINKEMAEALGELLSKKKVCIITGGNYEQIAKQVVELSIHIEELLILRMGFLKQTIIAPVLSI